MQPEVKGDELIEKFKKNRMDILTKQDSIPCILSDFPTQKTATKCAIIAVEEIISQLENLHKPEYTSFFHGGMGSGQTLDGYELKDFWNEVLNYLKSKL